jgi:alkanesulfonate monooxygenase SsuD/methylene tetrahydromethanopterin reductase-like flavin-dependent oxidoreductase (luciferase family)
MIGGGGERRTLRTVAAYADVWNVFGSPETVARKAEILDWHCAEIGRDPAAIERSVTIKLLIRDCPDDARRAWASQLRANGTSPEAHPDALLGPPATVAATLRRYLALGFGTVIADAPAPYDHETIERLATEVLPLCPVPSAVSGEEGPQ